MTMLTKWGAVLDRSCPLPEYPRPQFERTDWINLNGEWTYTFDFGASGLERGYAGSKGFDGKIIVPFAPESKLWGVGHTDFIGRIWSKCPACSADAAALRAHRSAASPRRKRCSTFAQSTGWRPTSR